MAEFVSRAGLKLEHALAEFAVDVAGKVCADLGCNAGGFADCLLRRGAAKVYAIDTGYGVLDWKLRKDPRVVVMERTNAMHVELPVAMELITIDVAWTKQRFIMPSAKRLLSPGGVIVSLVKPHYEAPPAKLRGGVLPEEFLHEVLSSVKTDVESAGMQWVAMTNSPIRGTGGNSEVLVMLRK